MKKHLIVAALLILIGAGCIGERPYVATEYRTRLSLTALDEKGKEHVVPLDLGLDDSWQGRRIVVSPDRKHVAFTELDNNAYVIKLADLPDGGHIRTVATQHVPEGSGSLDPSTLAWMDNQYLTFMESGIACGETGQPSTLNTGTECDGTVKVSVKIDINSGERIEMSRYLEVIKPLNPKP